MKIAVVVFTLVLSQVAAADPELRLSAGAGAGAAYYEPCGYMAPEGCSGQRLHASGASPLVLVGVRGTYQLTTNWKWRVGAIASATFIAPTTENTASLMTVAGEIGLERGRIGLDMILGATRVHVEDEGMSATSGTPMFGWTLTARISPTLALVGRLDVHVLMHSPSGGAFVGGGLEFTPDF